MPRPPRTLRYHCLALLALPLFCLSASAEDNLESRYLSDTRQVTSGMVKAGEGYFSPDGKQIVYQAVPQEYPFYQIYTQPLAGGRPELVSTGRGRTTCAYFSRDGKKILFASSHLDPMMEKTEQEEIAKQEEEKRTGTRRRYSWDFDPYTDIFVKDLETGKLTQLTDAHGYDAEGAYSYDGKKIAFCSDRDGHADLFIMDADGSNQKKLIGGPGYDGGPFISPNGKWVVYRTDRGKEEGYLQIHVIRTDGTDDTPLTDINGVNWAPYWHPTKPYIIWSGADHSRPGRPNYNLWLMKYEETDEGIKKLKTWQITDSPSADVLPVFSPDGTQLMWTSTRSEDGSSQLFIANFQLPEDEKKDQE